MHASLEQLISLRDEEPVAAEVQQHVRGCSDCARILNQMVAVREGLTALADPPPPAGAWEGIDAAMARRAVSARQRRWLAAGGTALAASVAAALLIVNPSLRAPAATDAGSTLVGAVTNRPLSVGELKAQSQYLEHAVLNINASADQMAVSAGTASTIAALEDRIALVDYEINSAASGGANQDTRLTQLWKQRVDLLQSLAAVRYAQVANSGI